MTRRQRGNGGRSKLGQTSARRPAHPRSGITPILIVCEGRETEPNYFRGLSQEETVRQTFKVVVKKGKGGSCLAVVEQAIAEFEKAVGRGEEFDEVWCVVDVEQAGQREQVLEARSLADRHEIRLALSNPAFECWFLAHFVRTKKSFADCDKVIEALNKHWRSEFKRNYEKYDEQVYLGLAKRTPMAIDHGRKVREQDWGLSTDIVDCNSATEVYRLVEHLLGPSE
jgi:RloB-like protein